MKNKFGYWILNNGKCIFNAEIFGTVDKGDMFGIRYVRESLSIENALTETQIKGMPGINLSALIQEIN